MKTKFLTIILVILTSLVFIPQVGANETQNNTSSEQAQNSDEQKIKKVPTPEKIPGADCKCVTKDISSPDGYKEISNAQCLALKPYERRYTCSHKRGVAGFQEFFSNIVRWIVNISIILGALAIASLGIAWMVQDIDNEESKKFLKGWIINIIIGLVILFMFRHILSIFGWIY